MNFLRLYGSYVAMYLKARMEYRFSFFSGISANFYCYFITYATFWTIVKKFGNLAGWGFADLTLLYGLNLLTYSLAAVFFWYTVFHLEEEITSGNLDSYLIRPIGLIQQMVCRRFGDTFLGQIVVTLLFLILTLGKISYQLTPWSVLYLILVIISGVLAQGGAMILFGSLSFWMLRSMSLARILYYDIRRFVHYPLSIFPGFIRILLTYALPYALINYYPSLLILNKVQTAEEFALSLASPLFGIGLFTFSIYLFKRGLKRYSGSGS